MKKYTILFALLVGMVLLIIETVPAVRVSAQSTCGGRTQPPCPPVNPVNPGGPEKPGPKNRKPTPVPTVIPTATPTLVVALKPLPYPHIYPIFYPQSYPTSVPKISLPPQNLYLCKIGPCWLFNLLSGDPVELLAIAGFIVFLVVIGFVFLRGRNTPRGGGGAIQ